MVLGHLDKTEGVNYLSDAQYISSTMPGPSTYKTNAKVVQPRITAVKIAPAKTKKQTSWKPKKSEEPDCGTYQVDKARHLVERSPVTHKISLSNTGSAANFREGSKGAGSGLKNSKSKETFTTIMTK